MKELKAGGVYSVVGIAQTLIWVVLLPIHTHYLSQEDYGLIALCTATVMGLATVLEFGLSRATAHTRFLNRNGVSTLQSELATPIKFLMLVALMVLVIAIVVEQLALFAIDQVSFPIIVLTVGATVALPIIRVYGEVLKMDGRFKHYAQLMFTVMVVNLISNLLFVAVFKMGPAGVLLSLLLANWVGVALVLFSIRQYLFSPFDWAGLKKELVYGVPLIPHFSVGAFMPMIERSLLTYFIGLQAAGIYAVAASLANMLTIITTSITTALRPKIFYLLEKERSHELNKIMIVTILGFVFLASIGALLSEFFVKLLTDKQFHDAWMLVPLLLLRQAIYGAYQFIASVFYFVREGTKKLILVSGVSVIILFLGSLLLVPIYGIDGMIYTSVLVALGYLFAAFFIGKTLNNMQWHIIRVCVVISLGGVLILGAFLSSNYKMVTTVIVLMALLYSMKVLYEILPKIENEPFEG